MDNVARVRGTLIVFAPGIPAAEVKDSGEC